jgi:hypothetical protein
MHYSDEAPAQSGAQRSPATLSADQYFYVFGADVQRLGFASLDCLANFLQAQRLSRGTNFF